MNSINSRPELGCYYFPNYHPDQRNAVTHGQGWTEWELVKQSRPRFSGHRQPAIPSWGYTDEADPEVMSRKISAAADHCIDYFIFDWYYYDDGPFLQRALEEGFMRAGNNQRIKFCCMWANHDWLDIHPARPDIRPKLLYPGTVKPETFDKICHLVIDKYFKHPSYYCINGAPYFSIYNLNCLLQSFGSVAETRKALERFRSMTREAGFPDLHLNAVVWGKPILPNERTVADLPQLVQALAFDSATSYVWIHHARLDLTPSVPYVRAMEDYFQHWDNMLKNFSIPYYPNLTVGWDPSPRTEQSLAWNPLGGYPYSSILSDNTPENFKRAMNMILQRLRKTDIFQTMNINCWNEWTEGSYLEPDSFHQLAYLEAIKDTMSSFDNA